MSVSLLCQRDKAFQCCALTLKETKLVFGGKSGSLKARACTHSSPWPNILLLLKDQPKSDGGFQHCYCMHDCTACLLVFLDGRERCPFGLCVSACGQEKGRRETLPPALQDSMWVLIAVLDVGFFVYLLSPVALWTVTAWTSPKVLPACFVSPPLQMKRVPAVRGWWRWVPSATPHDPLWLFLCDLTPLVSVQQQQHSHLENRIKWSAAESRAVHSPPPNAGVINPKLTRDFYYQRDAAPILFSCF